MSECVRSVDGQRSCIVSFLEHKTRQRTDLSCFLFVLWKYDCGSCRSRCSLCLVKMASVPLRAPLPPPHPVQAQGLEQITSDIKHMAVVKKANEEIFFFFFFDGFVTEPPPNFPRSPSFFSLCLHPLATLRSLWRRSCQPVIRAVKGADRETSF